MAGASHCLVKSLGGHRRHQVVNGPLRESPNGVIGARRNHDAQGMGVRPYRSQEIKAGHIRQLHIEEHDVRVESAGRVNGGYAAGGLADHLYVIVSLTEPDQAISVVGLVVDYQYFHVGSRPALHRHPAVPIDGLRLVIGFPLRTPASLLPAWPAR